jgi:hypothetical protein
MNHTFPQEKVKIDPDQVEIAQNAAVQGRSTYYKPQDYAEKKLDKRVNLKLDCIVLALLAVEFIVSFGHNRWYTLPADFDLSVLRH